ncbi:S-layer homology domain-containing protein [Paenibacillus sp. V4I7]|uniref:S-layer homology domain-containing protein n=1 Tax=Paenibacillus sp. V4I7 TaxID=3042307 RepID=UPI002780FA0F|nr:S-layer homology domain-containing protein [Paenibacillus sp. V4I7]MDQ0899015.1 hypothetical protein [Paenibacillus sp. V4I7]
MKTGTLKRMYRKAVNTSIILSMVTASLSPAVYAQEQDAISDYLKTVISAETFLKESVTQAVYAIDKNASLTPVIAPLPEAVNTETLDVKGTALPGSEVTIYVTKAHGSKAEGGKVIADAKGEFLAQVIFTGEGTYLITATATLGGEVSSESTAVQVRIDQTRPSTPSDFRWQTVGLDEVKVMWASGESGTEPLQYRIERNGVFVEETADTEFTDREVGELSALSYSIYAKDLAGNLSYPLEFIAGTAHHTQKNLNTSSSGELGNEGSRDVKLSGDGTKAVFISNATNLVEGAGNKEIGALFVKDLKSGNVKNLPLPAGVDSINSLNISENGRVIAFHADVLGTYDNLFVEEGAPAAKRMPTIDGEKPNEYVGPPSMSEDGEHIVFNALASNLTVDDTNNHADIFVYHRSLNQITRVKLTEELYGQEIQNPILSGDGRYVLFYIGCGECNTQRLYLQDLSLDGGTVLLADGYFERSISGNGRFIAYSKDEGIYIYDREASEENKHTRIVQGVSGETIYFEPQISSDGKHLIFTAFEFQPSQGYAFQGYRIYVVDLNDPNRTPRLLSNPATEAKSGTINGDGSKVGFIATATNSFDEQGFFRTGSFVVCPNTCQEVPQDKPIHKVTWKAPMASRAHIKLGSQLTVAVEGVENRNAAATITYLQGGTAQSRELTLVEQSPGKYTGEFEVQVGMTVLNSIVGKVADADGKMISLSAEGLPISVSAGIKVDLSNLLNPDHTVNVDVSAALIGSRLVAWSPSKKTGTQAAYHPNESFTLIVPDAEDYRLSLLASDGTLLAEKPEVIAAKGEILSISMKVIVPAKVTIKVLKAEGDKPLPYVAVWIQRAEQKDVIASGITNAQGEIGLPAGFIGDNIVVKIQVPRPYAAIEPISLKLERRQTDVSLQATIHYGTVSGQVKAPSGLPLPNAIVSIKQEDRSIEAISDGNGAFSEQLPEGKTIISGYLGGETVRRTLNVEAFQVEASKEKTFHLTLYKESTATIHLKLFTKLVGGDWIARNLSISELNLFVPTISTERGITLSPTYFDNGLTLKAAEGEKFRVCLRDRLGQLGSVCELVTIDEHMQATAELRLQEKLAVTGRTVLDEKGIWTIHAGFFEKDDQGKTGHSVTYSTLQPGKFHLSLPKAGSYFVTFTAIGEKNQVRKVTKTITVREGELTELGDLVLTPSGYFNQAGGNGLEALDSPVAEGSHVTMRGTYRNGSHEPIITPTLLIRIPEGTSLVPNSVVMNGSAVEDVAVGSDSHAKVKLPSDFAVGEEGTVLYQLQVNVIKSEFLTADIGMKFKQSVTDDFDEEEIARVLVQTTQISMDAPPKVDKTTFMVSGRAVPGSRVILYDGVRVAAETLASPGGYWNQRITLIDEQAQGRTHALSAVAVLGANEWRSKQVFVEYTDVDEPMPIHLSITAIDHRVDVDLTNGIARFPLAVNPQKPISFSLQFREPKRAQHVRVRLAGEEIPLAFNALTERYEGLKSTSQRHLGPIAVSYDVLPKPYQTVDSHENILKSMPPAFRSLKQEVLPLAEVASENKEMAAPDRTYVNKVVLTSADSPDEKIETQFFYAPMPVGYDPGPPPAKGPVVYNLKTQFNAQLGTMHVSAIVPVEQAKPFVQSLQGDLQSLSGAPYVEIGANFRFELKTPGSPSALGLASAIYAGYDYQQKMNELNAFMDQVGGGCTSASSIKHYNDELQNLAERLFQQLLLKYSLQMAAMGLAGVGIGFFAGVGVVATSFAINYAFNEAWESDLADLQQQFTTDQNNAECEDEDEQPPKRPKDPRDPDEKDIVDPYWIYDPSGYVFEAVESNRMKGVKTTALFLDPNDQTWKVWDAGIYGQQNPLLTDRAGKYAWDVPEGKWQVLYEKEGYETARSEVLEVLPPHYDVNVGIVSKAAPTVHALIPQADRTGLQLYFTKYMIPATLTPDHVTLTHIVNGVDAEQITIRIEPIQPENSPGGEPLAKQFRIVPETPLLAGQSYRVDVDAMVQSYSGTAMTQPYMQVVNITAPGPVAEAVKAGSMKLIHGQDALALSWEENAVARYDHLKMEWKEAGAGEPLGFEEVGPGIGLSSITGLEPGKNYEVKLLTVDLDGRVSEGELLTVSTLTKPEVSQNPAPGIVKNASLKIENGGLTLAWTDPSDADLRGVKVSIKKPGEVVFGPSVEVDKGVQLYRYEGLTAPGEYKVELKAIDASGKLADGVSVSATIRDEGDNPGNGGGGGPMPTEDPDTATLQIKEGQEHYDAFEGLLRIRLTKGALKEGSRIHLNRVQTSPSPLPAGYEAHSDYITITSEAQLSKPLQLTWKYSQVEKKDFDSRKLAVYKLDRTVPGGWRYLGGAARQGQNEISVKLDGWGTYTVMTYDKRFNDLNVHWSRKELEVLISRHLVDGVDEHHFSPDSPVTRAQVTKLLTNLLRHEGRLPEQHDSEHSFSDVFDTAWYAEPVRDAAAFGLVEGEDGKFRPDAPITREELAVIIQRILKAETSPAPTSLLSKFADSEDTASWGEEAMSLMVQEGIMNGVTETTLMPKGTTTRAQAAVILVRLLERWGKSDK